MTRRAPHIRIAAAALLAMTLLYFGASTAGATAPPNIVLILADDLGFSDTAPYGSEIRTPTLTALAANGVTFTNYHTAASCAPTRAMLLTGVDSHRAGVSNIPEMIPPEQRQHRNYQGVLGSNVVTVATLLQDAGYHTYMAGKWHLGMSPDLLPSSRGFERTVAMADSGADNWEQKPYMPIYPEANWFADGERYELPEDFYSSRFLIDKTIEFIDSNAADGRPFFAYIPFQAVHIPVQAPREFSDRYAHTYRAGWQALREQRLASAVALGIVPVDTAMVTMSTTADWDALSPGQQRFQSRSMAVYAGMVEAMDYHTGRLVQHLKDTGLYSNTIFLFASDNGSEASGLANPTSPLARFALSRQGYNNDYETLGLKGSFNSLTPSFASATASPLAFYKFYVGEGGMRVPLIISGDLIAQKQHLSHAFTFVTDITPTILQMAGVGPPPKRYGGRLIEPIVGRGLASLLAGEVDRVYAEEEAVGCELAGSAALFQGNYKLVKNRGPVGDSHWHLFDIATDPGETRDLAVTMPARVESMFALYEEYAANNGVLPIPENYSGTRQMAINGLHDRYGRQILLGIISLLVLVPFFVVYRRQSRTL